MKNFGAIIEKGVVLSSFNHISENSHIGKGSKLSSFNIIKNTLVGENCVIHGSNIQDSIIKNNVNIGPFSYMRPDTLLEDNTKVGAFVEIKKSTVGKGSKVPHLSYVGGGTIGDNCNIGCGVIFCNYDGKNKYQTIIEDNVFVGSNTNLVAPITLAKGSFVAAGSTLTEDVPAGALAIARQRQVNKLDYKRKN